MQLRDDGGWSCFCRLAVITVSPHLLHSSTATSMIFERIDKESIPKPGVGGNRNATMAIATLKMEYVTLSAHCRGCSKGTNQTHAD